MVELILHIGQRPVRSGRIGLATILHRSDFDAYRILGSSITGATYIASAEPGYPNVPRNPIRAALYGWRWGRIQHRLLSGTLRRDEAEWIERQWNGRVPL